MSVRIHRTKDDIEAGLAYARWKRQAEFSAQLTKNAPAGVRSRTTPVCLNTRGKRVYDSVLMELRREKKDGAVMLADAERKAVVHRLCELKDGRTAQANKPTKVITRASLKLTGVQKFVGGGKRIVRGIASTATTDRQGDVVEPRGGHWTLPVPALWMHKHDQPIGWVRAATVTRAGIEIEMEIATGIGKSDEAWAMVESGLVDSFSIGFRTNSWEPLPSGGLRFTDWELLEVSIVTIPANPDAKIRRGMHQASRGIPLVSAQRGC